MRPVGVQGVANGVGLALAPVVAVQASEQVTAELALQGGEDRGPGAEGEVDDRPWIVLRVGADGRGHGSSVGVWGVRANVNDGLWRLGGFRRRWS